MSALPDDLSRTRALFEHWRACSFGKMACGRKIKSQIDAFGVTIASTCPHRHEQAVSSFLAGQPHGVGASVGSFAGRYPAGARSPVIDAPGAAATRLL